MNIPKLTDLSLEQKVGQIFCINLEQKDINNTRKIIQTCKPGGLMCGFTENKEIKNILNDLQSLSDIPMLTASDIEPSSNAIKGLTNFTSLMGIGATRDINIAYKIGLIQGLESKSVGINWGFTPVLDVNRNSKNPIINYRSFGDDKELVIKMGKAYIKGFNDAGVLSCAKHFPGHGNTDKDSHVDVVISKSSPEEFKKIDLATFAAVIKEVPTIMTAHLVVPHIDNKIATLSKIILNDILRNELGFEGVIVTDSLSMGAVSKHYSPKEYIKEAFLAGCDILLLYKDKIDNINYMKKMIEREEILESRLDESVERILKAKRKIFEQKTENFNISFDKNQDFALEVAEKSITLIKNNILPINFEKAKSGITAITVRDFAGNFFVKDDNFISFIENKSKLLKIKFEKSQDLYSEIPSEHILIIALFSSVRFHDDEIGLLEKDINQINNLIKKFSSKLIIVNFGNPYAIQDLELNLTTCLLAYDFTRSTSLAVSKAIFGEIEIRGISPITVRQVINYQS